MGELERGRRGTPTSRHIRPELLAAFGMLLPERSQVLRAYYQDVDERWRRRAGEFEQELLNAASCTPEEIIDRIVNDERAGELFERGVQEAILTANERKRRLLARAVASGVLATDDAMIDEKRFILDAVVALETSHLHVLAQIAQRHADYGEERDQSGNRRAHGWTLPALNASLPGLAPILRPVLGTLSANGLIDDTAIGTLGYEPRWAITEYGKQVLGMLQEVDAEGS